jgi:hypothetical protein
VVPTHLYTHPLTFHTCSIHTSHSARLKLEIRACNQSYIGGHARAIAQHDNIAHDQFFCFQCLNASIAHDQRLLGQHFGKAVDDLPMIYVPLGAEAYPQRFAFLDEAADGHEKHNHKQGESGGQVGVLGGVRNVPTIKVTLTGHMWKRLKSIISSSKYAVCHLYMVT